MDDVIFDTENSDQVKSMVFGCANEETGEFFNQKADGILGIGLNEKNRNPSNLIQTENREKRLPFGAFSLCLGINGGFINFDDKNHKQHAKNAKTTEIKAKSKWYRQFSVGINSIQIDGVEKTLDFSNNETSGFFDSGTTYTYLTSDISNYIFRSIKDYCK